MAVERSLAEQIIERIEAQVDELIRILAAMPEDRWTRKPAPDEWSAAEVCGHIIEMMPFWAAQARAVAASPGLRFGRSEEDERRIEGIVRGARLSRHDAVEQIRAAAATAARAIRALPAAAWQAQGLHPTRGPMTVAEILTRLLAEHLESHVEQVQRSLT